ncbi:lipoprotein BA_5634 family protein [Paenibacillus larvae]|uniref:Putative lipoprotein n=1 Tax=Paenibacillus larvae subsp. larvae TaxID=147375 RepID=A0A6C0QLZ9_9BACL|nr:lipoprotein BA_5634 family protein [Paenibacillus larvae]QHZ49742.1 putative lipoprotein [Paenibacillus larvae subsp. larvae]
MRKMAGFGLSLALFAILLSGCSLFGEGANGVLIFGDFKQVEAKIEEKKSDLASNEIQKIKVTKQGDETVLIMSKSTADSLQKKGLFRKIIDKDKTEILSSFPNVSKGKPLLFAKKESSSLTLDGNQVSVKYEGNYIVGPGRTYADQIVIADDADMVAMPGTEKAMGILETKKDPSEQIGSFGENVDKVQSVTIKKT